ncbi:acid-sensing ion channel 2-like [Oculina patagonica]
MEMHDMVSQNGSEQTRRESKTTSWSLIKDFCDYTTAHGLGRIMAATHWARTILWALLYIGAVVVMTLQVHTLFKRYQSRPLTTFVTVETSSSLPFPAVTFCNFNAIRNDSLHTVKDYGLDIFEELFTAEIAKNATNKQRKRRANPDAESTLSPTLESLYDEDEEDNDSFWDDDDNEEFEDPSKKEPSYLKREQMAILMAKEKTVLLSMLGHTFEDMVLSCTYRGVSCRNFSSVFWKTFWHYKYGNCYVFNSGKTKTGENAPILKSNKPGPSHGLTLELNIEQEQYIDLLSPEAGIKMDISTQGEMPFPLQRGVSLPPGYATMIGLRKEVIKRKDPFENERCLKTVSTDESNLYTKYFGAMYSTTACKESCLAYNQLGECGCMEYRFPGSFKHGICNVISKPNIKCLSKLQKLFKENKLNCTDSCPPPCKEEGFKMSTSFAFWPSENFESVYQDDLLEKSKQLFTKNGSHRKNVCKVQVFYEELNLEVITEQRSYEIEDFVSDIGGQLGLWIGFSVLTAAEFLELIMLLCHFAVKKCSTKKSTEPNHVSQPI